MSDPTGVPSALGIEAVEWSAQGAENIVLQVTGRWRRRRPTWSGQPTLVVEAQGTRHRFPAMPEPPSLSGAAPGTWRMSFSIPASLAPHLGGKAWLQLGAVVVPLPVDVEPVPAAQPPADPGLLVQRRLRSYELAVEAARRRATEAEEASAQLNARIDQLELELEQLRGELAGHARARRSAEQRAHSERLLREELQEELAEQARAQADTAGTLEELAETEARLAELEAEIAVLRRRADEAEQAAAAAQAARRRAERQPPAPQPPVGEPADSARAAPRPIRMAEVIRSETALARWNVNGRAGELSGQISPLSPSPAAAAAPGDALRLGQERALVLARSPAAGPRTDRAAQGQTTSAPPAQAYPGPSPPLVAVTLAELRAELGELREIAERESTAREQAQSRVNSLELLLAEQSARCARAYAAIADLRGALESVRLGQAGESQPPPQSQPPPPQSQPPPPRSQPAPPESQPPQARIEPERLAAALERLRAAAAEHSEADPAASTSDRPRGGTDAISIGSESVPHPWLGRAFRSLADRDATAAGRLTLALLPALRVTARGSIAFDLVLADVGCLHVDVAGGAPRIRRADSPRTPGPGQLRVEGDLASLARLLAAGRLRRRLGRGVARWRGDRHALNQLLAMVRAPVSLRGLHRAGVRPEPALSLWLAAVMIEPGWTAGAGFTIAHQEPETSGTGTYLEVRDGARPIVTQMAPLGPVATTIVCPAGSLLLLLDGSEAVDAELRGDPRPLALLQGWVKRAQSG